jgi:hypothetical protein
MRRDLYSDIAVPGGVANKSFVAEWACFCQAMDSNDFLRLPSHSALALKLLSKCAARVAATPKETTSQARPAAAAGACRLFACLQAGMLACSQKLWSTADRYTCQSSSCGVQ